MNDVDTAIKILTERQFGDSLAGVLHAIQCAQGCLESALSEALEAAGVPWEDHSTDYYDNSLELTGVGDHVMTPQQLEAIWALGFDRMWTNPGDERHSAGERSYFNTTATGGLRQC